MSKSPYDKYPPFGEEYPHKAPDWYERQKPSKPKPVTILDLFPNLERLSIGYSPILSNLKEITAAKPSYPPYDLLKMDDEHNLLNVAIAGFSKEEIKVTVQDSVLTIEGKRKEKQQGEIIHQGIAARDFTLKLALAEYWEVVSAIVQDGMLAITLHKSLPEEKKPKVIEIQ